MKLRIGQFNIKTTFLYSDLDEEIYMRIPEGFVRYMLDVHNKTIDLPAHVLLSKKALYGLLLAALQLLMNFKEAMAGCNYCPSKDDTCLFIKKAKGDEILSSVIIYVDDGGIGTPELIKFIEAISKSFKVMTMDEMRKFVGCHIIDTANKDGVWIHQPKLLNNLKKSFKYLIEESARVFKTPSAPKTLIIRPKDGDPLISPEKQKQFRMGSHPNILKSVR
jgi:Reverse transcriptase (RNA-dependent DNA polymerase)